VTINPQPLQSAESFSRNRFQRASWLVAVHAMTVLASTSSGREFLTGRLRWTIVARQLDDVAPGLRLSRQEIRQQTSICRCRVDQ